METGGTGMSRCYEFRIRITKHEPARREEIEAALGEIISFDFDQETDDGIPCLTGTGEGNLCGGQTEEEFAKELAGIVFAANGGRCVVNVGCVCLEDLPVEEYEFGGEAEA